MKINAKDFKDLIPNPPKKEEFKNEIWTIGPNVLPNTVGELKKFLLQQDFIKKIDGIDGSNIVIKFDKKKDAEKDEVILEQESGGGGDDDEESDESDPPDSDNSDYEEVMEERAKKKAAKKAAKASSPVVKKLAFT